MSKSLILGWVIPGLAAIAVAGVLLAWQWPAPTPEAGETVTQTGVDNDAAKTTADLVTIRAVRTDARTLRVTLDIAGDWHVNANPASLDFLIPTVLSARTDVPVPLTVDYPAGHDIDSGLGDAPWRVYDDGSVITATLPEASATEPLSVEVQVQACHDSGRCLTPDTVRAQADAP